MITVLNHSYCMNAWFLLLASTVPTMQLSLLSVLFLNHWWRGPPGNPVMKRSSGWSTTSLRATEFIPTIILKSCSDVFVPLVSTLTNFSFSEARFPDVFKFGQVTLLLKKPRANDKDMTNFWPITNLNTISEILEHLAQNQIRRHTQGSLNLGSLQSAYRMLHSTETAMTSVVNDLFVAADNKTPSVLLSLDISAAFDTLDHHRLIERAKNSSESTTWS